MTAKGKTPAVLARIAEERRLLAAIQPASVRAVAYQMFVRGLLPTMAKTETNKISDDLVWAREQPEDSPFNVPWEWIVDETRREEALPVWGDLGAFLRDVARSYRRDLWADQPVHLEVWSEKGTVRAVLAPILNTYRVPFRVLHGFNSATVVKDTADASLDLPTDRPFVALYIGDYDPSGWFMSEIDLPDRLARYGGDVELHRIALTPADGPGRTVDPFTGQPLPGYDVLAADRLFPRGHPRAGQPKNNCTPRYTAEAGAGRTGYELDAMAPPTLRARVEQAITSQIDADAWQASLDEEEVDQARLEEILGDLS